MDPNTISAGIAAIDRIGSIGLAFIVLGLLRGWLVPGWMHKERIARLESRNERLETQLFAALDLGKQSVATAGTLVRVIEEKRP